MNDEEKVFEKMLPNVLGIINDKFYTTNIREGKAQIYTK